MKFSYFKYHALGNDYLVVDPNKTQFPLEPECIRLLCHRNFGVGSDGILYGPIFEDGLPGVRIFNPDGGEAEKSGNGARIFARYLLDQGYVANRPFRLRTAGGEVAVAFLDDGGGRIAVDMGTVTFHSPAIPVAGAARQVIDEAITLAGETYRMTCLSIGNPHCVIPLAAISRDLAERLGPQVERHALFPNRINLQLLQVLDANNIRIEIWERGAGYTLASGSSSCAAACAAHQLGLIENQVTVHMPGGTIEIAIGNDGHVLMTGAVTGVAQGELLPDLAAALQRGTAS